ncbi:Archaeal holliday junction resolvase (hjc) [Thermoplasmatales archaeon BRNA1]|nr:Archaeal holliday junction resolvase (hjc) [Thermoplasmatales archaeon BRNA1]
MAPAGDTYERELKYLLSGDEKTIRKMVKTCSEEETVAYTSMFDHPFLMIRAAGSLGVDLVALRWDFSFPIEVKSSEKDTLYMSKSERLGDQADEMLSTCNKSHIIPIYAYRLKGVRGDPWRIFTIPSDCPLKGTAALLRRRIPMLDVSRGGNFIMRWNDGMKLSDFLHYVGLSCYESLPPEEAVSYEEEAACDE